MKKHDLVLLFLGAVTIFAVNIAVSSTQTQRLRQMPVQAAVSKDTSADATTYQSGAAATVQTFSETYQVATTREGRITAITAARDKLLAERVPADYKDVHLALVLIFDQLAAADASTDQDAIFNALSKLRAITEANPWLVAK